MCHATINTGNQIIEIIVNSVVRTPVSDMGIYWNNGSTSTINFTIVDNNDTDEEIELNIGNHTRITLTNTETNNTQTFLSKRLMKLE